MKTTNCLYDADDCWGILNRKTLTPLLPSGKFDVRFPVINQNQWQKWNFYKTITVSFLGLVIEVLGRFSDSP